MRVHPRYIVRSFSGNIRDVAASAGIADLLAF